MTIAFVVVVKNISNAMEQIAKLFYVYTTHHLEL
jgi:hypothetical protein